MYHASARIFEGTVAVENTTEYYQLAVNSVGSINVTDWLNRDFPLFVHFSRYPTIGDPNPNYGRVIQVTEWYDTTQTFTLADALSLPVAEGEQFMLYYPNGVYEDYVDSSGTPEPAVWPLIETFCDLYGQEIDAEGFRVTAIKWAAEQARAQTLALPKNLYTVYCGPGSVTNWYPPNEESVADWYDGELEYVSFAATYPNTPGNPLVCQDGWLNYLDWYEITAQAMN